jgi:hypothetical protein
MGAGFGVNLGRWRGLTVPVWWLRVFFWVCFGGLYGSLLR